MSTEAGGGRTLEGVLEAHVRGDWSDGTYSCGGCADRFEESIQERWEKGTDEERWALRAELHKHMKPGWSMADYNAHVAAEVRAWLGEVLAGEGLREDVAEAIGDEGSQAFTPWEQFADAALDAVRGALGVAG